MWDLLKKFSPNVSTHIPAILKVMLLLQEHEVTKVVDSDTIIPQYLKL
jgi:hypothetical protein